MSAAAWRAKLASPVLLASGSYARRWARAAAQAPLCVVLVYHRVVPEAQRDRHRFGIENGIGARAFERQMRFMRDHFTPCRCSGVLAPDRGRLSFAVSFDDGYHDNYAVAAPILRRLGIPATFFVISDFVGSDRLLWWEQVAAIVRETRCPRLEPAALGPALAARLAPDGGTLALDGPAPRAAAYEALCAALRAGPGDAIPVLVLRLSELLAVPLREHGREHRLMNWDEVRALAREGFEIGGHTATHCNVATAPLAALESEIVVSQRVIEEHLQQPVSSFAYPYGFDDPAREEVTRLLHAAGCQVAFTGHKGVVDGSQPTYALPRARLNRGLRFACAYNVEDARNAAPQRRKR